MLKALAKTQGIQTVALNKIYYLGQKDYETLKVLSAIKQGTTLRDKNVTPITGRYFLSIPEMEQIYDADDLRRTDAVSYTHLDVYKRQGLLFVCVLPFNLIKGCVVSVITRLLYKRISSFLH